MSMENKFDFDREFSRSRDITYLDHAGTTLYAQSQLEACFKDLSSNLYGNPHSNNPSSSLSAEAIEEARELVLSHFNTDSDHYQVVFTSGCTESLKLVGEIFPWHGKGSSTGCHDSEVLYVDREQSEGCSEPNKETHSSVFCYLEDNHTSVVGIREIASQYGAQLLCITEEAITNCATINEHLHSPLYHLFAYTAQSNFSGCKYPLLWSTQLPNNDVTIKGISAPGTWLVLLDAASFAATNYLDLQSYSAHFVTLSFYKLFGYPTGLGALLIRQDIADCLEKPYFGGGTVLSSITRTRYHRSRPLLHERFEDGTVSFLDIAVLKHGFQTLKRFNLTMEDISTHTYHLASMAYHKMKALKHSNGQPLCVLYNKEDFTDRSRQGGIIAFNLLKSDGNHIGYSEVDKMATLHSIHLRTGCFCNSGACQVALRLSCNQLLSNLKSGHVCGDDVDIIDGLPTGCVRISFGYMSRCKDIEVFINFITKCFLDGEHNTMNNFLSPKLLTVSCTVDTSISEECSEQHSSFISGENHKLKRNRPVITISGNGVRSYYTLNKIMIYPVKSCSGYEVLEWPISEKGLLWDRVWMILSERGSCLSQKQEPRLSLIHPTVDPLSGTLTLKYINSPDDGIIVKPHDTSSLHCKTKICGDKVEGIDCGDEVADWLYKVLGRNCRLLQMDTNVQRKREGKNVSLSFTNKAQYLLLTQSSLKYLHSVLLSKLDLKDTKLSLNDLTMRFRPNLVVCQSSEYHQTEEDLPFIEDSWKYINIDGLQFIVLEGCSRCQMIGIDQETGSRSDEPLQTLLTLRGSQAKFGIYLAMTGQEPEFKTKRLDN